MALSDHAAWQTEHPPEAPTGPEQIGEVVGTIGDHSEAPAQLDTTDDLDWWSLRGDTDDPAVVRRAKAAFAVGPIHDLVRNSPMAEGDFWEHYDLFALSLAVIDQVAMGMTVSAGMGLDEARDFLAAECARQVPPRPEAEHRVVAERVVDALARPDPYEYEYTAFEESGPVRRTYSFTLLYEQWAADQTTIHLRATPQAVNVLVNGLDFDSESATAADEFQIRRAIDSGAFSSAIASARNARYRSVADIERIRSIIRDTQLDSATHDWSSDVPLLLRAGSTTSRPRRRVEDALIDAIEDRAARARRPRCPA